MYLKKPHWPIVGLKHVQGCLHVQLFNIAPHNHIAVEIAWIRHFTFQLFKEILGQRLDIQFVENEMKIALWHHCIDHLEQLQSWTDTKPEPTRHGRTLTQNVRLTLIGLVLPTISYNELLIIPKLKIYQFEIVLIIILENAVLYLYFYPRRRLWSPRADNFLKILQDITLKDNSFIFPIS